MKNLLMVLASVALLAVILAAGVFGYKSFTDINNSKEDKNGEEVKSNKEKESKKEAKKEQKNEEQNVEESTELAQEQTVEKNKELDVNAEIAKADKDGDGVATRDEMTPELWELTRQGKFQPTSREIYYQDPNASEKDDEPVTDNEVNNIDDEEERGDVGMDMEQQQRNIDALKESE
ncbi:MULTISPECIES: hypothetical protein [Staphylococcus]|uniref:hypothetical protein n=1 Tax=Staphylococcus TaxID=1279 RepID=UPI00069DDEF6|nr:MULTISPECIES: hypothetical protein [Staphylococcus]HDJ7737284.1 hypothetical protein [Staphylococcus aureus]MBF2758338.1 hypothetical protein [Staphylococcus haemolyticus]MBF2774538.1 hypothetical protein [Staphylococcus haemolyticus]MBF2777149.1 hypothetical protein [Staphylococcus haemolyticus]MBF2815556.1 hypothetical protein [Staphylococcus haemolyticus]